LYVEHAEILIKLNLLQKEAPWALIWVF
jgi:hypothetical protein